MAVINPDAVGVLYNTNQPHKFVVLGLKGVTTGDTLDLSAHFSKVQVAAFFATTALANSLPTLAGGVLTFAGLGLSNDSGYLVILGAPASF